MINVAVGIIHNPDNAQQILLGQRLAHQDFAGCWEFPGGKFETGETFAAALQRELFEELGIQVMESRPWFCLQHIYPHKTVRLHIANVTSFAGTPKGLEQQPIAWVPRDELALHQLPEANAVIVEALSQWHRP